LLKHIVSPAAFGTTVSWDGDGSAKAAVVGRRIQRYSCGEISEIDYLHSCLDMQALYAMHGGGAEQADGAIEASFAALTVGDGRSDDCAFEPGFFAALRGML
jgi:hypothetical protein